MNNWYNSIFQIGKMSGCHQISERSFFYKGKQFPVCARCTGALIGYFVGGLINRILTIPFELAILFCVVMFIDWFLQKIRILPSNNIRRLITGFLCGFSLFSTVFEL